MSLKYKKELCNNLKKLKEISDLKDNWNDNNAKKFSPELISIVKNILENIVEQPEIFPTANNSIQMEYELIDNSYLEFEIFEDKIICLEVPQRNYSKYKEQIIPNDIKIINNIVNNFFERSDIDES
jgi:hypothetical protein